MKTTRLFILSFIFLISCSTYSTPPTNLAVEKDKIKTYVASGAYEQDIQYAINEGKVFLDKRLKQQATKPLAIVFDIDETTLSNFPHMIELSFGGRLQDIKKFENLGTDPVILPSLALYNYAKAHDITLFFITGRKEKQRKQTEENLKHAGYTHWKALYMQPNDTKYKSAADFKTPIRKQIENEGYEIVLNISDQESDLAGGHADKTVLLPNPFYFIP